MSDDVRDLNELAVAIKRQIDGVRRRIAVMPKDRRAAELAKYPGLEPWLAATEGLGKRPDADRATVYDRIRQDVARKRTPHPDESISLEERLRR